MTGKGCTLVNKEHWYGLREKELIYCLTGDNFAVLNFEFQDLKWRYSGQHAATIYSATKRCNIVAIFISSWHNIIPIPSP